MTGGQHSAEFQRLIERRQKFIDGLDANKGEINLDIFEDFYPDRAHFVYELLQNAEDAGATEVIFTLSPDRLVCEHNGRPFSIEDVTSITGLHDSTKAKAQDKIGKFGVGFKSVFVYTQAPSIHSGDFSFRIVQLILPELISCDQPSGTKTRFEFPFNSPKKTAFEAYAEISAGMSELDEKTLLFLTNLRSVKWVNDKDVGGEVLRLQHSEFHYEVLKESAGKTVSSSHFLKFDAVVSGLDKQRVAVAFPLDALPGVRQFEQEKPIEHQFKIVPAAVGNVAVFFPAAKETSGLRFHLHGPFVPELSRASIKDTELNQPLFEQLATLTARALHEIKALGLLTPEFLSVLPCPQDQISPRYAGIRTAIIEEMRSQPLTPTHDRRHAAANRLIQARATLKSLLSESDIEYLVSYDDEPPLWAMGATQRNQRVDNFLTGLNIQQWGIDEFVEALCELAEDSLANQPDEAFLEWLAQKSPAWMQEFYALLNTEASDDSYRLDSLRIVRLTDGKLSRADHVFFPSENTGPDLPAVDSAVYSFGTAKKQQLEAKAFLELIGVREVGEAEEIEIILNSRYTKEADIPDDEVYLSDLKRFIGLWEKQPDKAKLFSEFYVLQGGDDNWYCPKDVYLDKPFIDTGVSAYYEALTNDGQPEPLHPSYVDCGLDPERIGKFAKAIGAKVGLEIGRCTISDNPERSYLIMVGGSRASSVINRDFYIPQLAKLMNKPSLELSRLIWRTLVSLPAYPDYLRATYQLNKSHGARHANSLLVHELRAARWIPQGDGVFVRPTDAAREKLPKGFPFDAGDAWIKAIQFGETAAKASVQATQREATAKSLGFTNAATADRARRIAELMSEEEQEDFLAELENSHDKGPTPDRTLLSPGRRARNVFEQALNAPNKETEVRERAVPVGRKPVKDQAKVYLREHYRNSDHEMTCQICKKPLPFNLEDGEGHFECVGFLPELTKEHYQNYLALCPNHAAMFLLVNASKETMLGDFKAMTSNELIVLLAEKELTIYFSKIHAIDLKAVIDAESELLEPLAEELTATETV